MPTTSGPTVRRSIMADSGTMAAGPPTSTASTTILLTTIARYVTSTSILSWYILTLCWLLFCWILFTSFHTLTSVLPRNTFKKGTFLNIFWTVNRWKLMISCLSIGVARVQMRGISIYCHADWMSTDLNNWTSVFKSQGQIFLPHKVFFLIKNVVVSVCWQFHNLIRGKFSWV